MQVLHRLDLNDVIVQNVLLASIPQEEAELPAQVGWLFSSVVLTNNSAPGRRQWSLATDNSAPVVSISGDVCIAC